MVKMKEIERPKFKDYTNQPVNFLQPKLDGHFTMIKKTAGSYICTTKNDIDITDKLLKISHIKQELDSLPDDSCVMAERHSPGVPASSVPTLLNDADERMMLTVFAAPILHGVDFSDTDLGFVMLKVKQLGLSVAAVTKVRTEFVDEKGKQALLELAIQNKWEGWVLKESHMSGWYKLKPVKTIDGFVINTYKSTSDSFKGGLKCIRIGVWNEDGSIRDLGTAGNGFKKPYRLQFMSEERIAEARKEFLNTTKLKDEKLEEELAIYDLPRLEFDSLLNKVCEIAYDSIPVKGGKLRFPRFIRWRDDKDINDCTIDQLGEEYE